MTTLQEQQQLQALRDSILQSRSRDHNSSLDRLVKASGHQLSLVERWNRMAIENVRLHAELAERRVALAAKWISVMNDAEKLAAYRAARRRFEGEQKRLSRELRTLQKKHKTWSRWLDAADDLIWGSLIHSRRLSAAWRGLFSIVQALPGSAQRSFLPLPLPKEIKQVAGYDPKTDKVTILNLPVYTKGRSKGRRRMNTQLEMFDFVRDHKLCFTHGSKEMALLTSFMEAIDVSVADQLAKLMVSAASARSSLRDIRVQNWKKHNLI